MMATHSASFFLEIKNLCFSFSGHKKPLFQRFNLSVISDEVFTLIGPGGGGKTTLLKLIAGLLHPEKGKIRLQGKSISDHWRELGRDASLPIGMSFQKSGLFDSLNCGENLCFPLRERTHLTNAEITDRVREALSEVGLDGIERLRVHEISGGMQKRLGIARALILRPRLILYDDPTAGLDPITSRAIADLILAMKKKHRMTAIVVTSDLNQAFHLSDRIGFLHAGQLIEINGPELLKKSSNEWVHQFVHGDLDGPLSDQEALA